MLEKLKTTTDIAKLGSSSNYGLFVSTEPGSQSGVWLDLESTIEKYATEGVIKSGVSQYITAPPLLLAGLYYCVQDTVEFRSKMRLLRLNTPDNAMKTLYVDEGRTVEKLMDDICHRLRITSNNEFSLARNTEVLESKGTMRSFKAKAMKEIRKNLRTEETG